MKVLQWQLEATACQLEAACVFYIYKLHIMCNMYPCENLA